MKKKIIRLTESELLSLVKKCVIKEIDNMKSDAISDGNDYRKSEAYEDIVGLSNINYGNDAMKKFEMKKVK